jgi:predicted RNA-binding Zn-ribbon protein involved in translation (DUF1610 family)
MANTIKTCPKCSAELGYLQHVSVIPALNNPSGYSEPVSTSSGLPVVLFVCPGCSYVEMYRQQI